MLKMMYYLNNIGTITSLTAGTDKLIFSTTRIVIMGYMHFDLRPRTPCN